MKPRKVDNKKNAARVKKCRAKKRIIATSRPSVSKRAGLSFTRPAPDDAPGWLLTYLPAAFPLPFGPVHLQIIDAFDLSLRTGDSTAIAAPRGTGKSTLVNGLALRALLEGQTAFPCVIPWDDKAKRRALRFWASELCFNVRLHRDYPEATAPFRVSKGAANRLSALTSEEGEATGARLGITEGVIVLPDGRGAIGSATINGNPRGLNYTSIDGRVIRPTLGIVDDPQDRKTAKSRARVVDTIDRINADVSGMAGPDTRMPIIMPCTVIETDDVAEHFLNHPDWRAVRVGQVVTWPDGWDDKHSEARRLWVEWNELRLNGENAAVAVEFYAAHKAAMVAGMTVSWEARFDAKRGQPDAFYAAILDWHVMGEDAFAAERQNAPIKHGVTVYNLTPEIIVSRATDRPAGAVPDWSRMRIAATDINTSYGLTWGVVAFGSDQTAAVLAYGVHEMSVATGATEAETARATYEALVVHGCNLAALPCKPETWIIDAGGTAFDVVIRFAAESMRLCGLQAIPATGRGSKNYRPYGKSVLGKPREQCHMAVDLKGRKWVAWHADYWREQAQKAWTGSVGAPGSCSLPTGHHREFAEQICREQLAGKAEVGGMMMWNWHTQPGRHDYGDCMAMAYMGAAWQGIGTQGDVPQAPRPKARVVVYRPSQQQRR
jgi:energy-coupling factor transporter ATP-binding protein EcfA2